jgi:hypothetical protein
MPAWQPSCPPRTPSQLRPVGRGDSGDTLPYAVEREVEDIAAVIEATGRAGWPLRHLVGRRACPPRGRGARLHGPKLAIWEAPLFRRSALRPPLDTVEQYRKRLDAGHPEEAAEYFMAEVVRLPKEFVEYAKTQPFFAGQVKIAHTRVRRPVHGRLPDPDRRCGSR